MDKTLSHVRSHVDELLFTYLRKKKKTLLVTAISDLLLAGGKRIRPALLYVSYKGFGGKDNELIFTVGAALELFHTFALIHDDIIDNSDARRGKQTAMRKYGVPVAILAGDQALMYANELFYSLQDRLPQSAQFQWQTLQEEVILGEFLDASAIIDNIINSGNFQNLEQKVMEIMEYKTARYSVERPLLLGAVLAKASKQEQERLGQFGRKVGLAFQIQDDILGVFGDEKQTGKSASSDLTEGKLTLLLAKLMHAYPDKNELGENSTNVSWIRETLKQYKIDQECNKFARQLVAEAKGALSGVRILRNENDFLLEFAEYVISRNT